MSQELLTQLKELAMDVSTTDVTAMESIVLAGVTPEDKWKQVQLTEERFKNTLEIVDPSDRLFVASPAKNIRNSHGDLVVDTGVKDPPGEKYPNYSSSLFHSVLNELRKYEPILDFVRPRVQYGIVSCAEVLPIEEAVEIDVDGCLSTFKVDDGISARDKVYRALAAACARSEYDTLPPMMRAAFNSQWNTLPPTFKSGTPARTLWGNLAVWLIFDEPAAVVNQSLAGVGLRGFDHVITRMTQIVSRNSIVVPLFRTHR